MPNSFIQKLSKETGKSIDTLEIYWSEAKTQANEKGLDDNSKYAYIVSIVKKRAGISECINFVHSSISAKEFLK